MNYVLPTLLIAAVTVAEYAPAQTLKGRKWKHEKYGIHLTIPADYEVVPLQIDEKWIAAKFLSEKSYISKSKDWNHEHKPLMRVIVFSEEAKKGTGTEVHESEDGKTKFVGIGAVPYQGYRDYVKRHRSGFFFSKEDEDDVAGQQCLMCEIEVHKSEPRLHIYTAVFRQPTFELAVEFECLEDRKDRVEKHIMRTLNSVRFTEPEATAVITGNKESRRTSTRLWTAFRSEWRKRPFAERREIRKEMEETHHEKVRQLTPDDWTVSESKHFLVVSHAGDKFTKQMTEGAEMFYEWCEKNFGKLGDDYVRRPVLRLCKDSDEYEAFHFDSSNSTGWSLVGAEREIGTYYDNYNGSSGRDVSLLFPGILVHFLQEKDPYIVSYTPYWLTWSLNDYVSECYVKGRKLDFRVDDYTRDEAREMVREEKLPKLQELLKRSEREFTAAMNKDRRNAYATSQALRYVLEQNRDKAFKDFIIRYFEAAIEVGEKHGSDFKNVKYKAAETEEEEEQREKEYAEQSKARAKKLQEEINKRVLSEIPEKTWTKHEKKFAKFVKKGK
ncbi:MAG: hypothetical protein KAI24_14280 [Planctomycetes bacterium]|nr:hypothetical protein [Planctomycetota bacterium]